MTRSLLAITLATLCGANLAAAVCPGDCNGDGVVVVNELVSGVAIALGNLPTSTCPAFDGDASGSVDIAELLAGVNGALNGCFAATVTPGGTTATPTDTPAIPTTAPTDTPPIPTASDSPTPTATVGQNQPPLLPTPMLYQGFAGFPIALPIGAVDPEGGPVTCQADGLVDGMTLEDGAVLHWTPSESQIGPQLIPFTCSDGGEPPETSSGMLGLQIAADDSCAMPTCDPATGCTASLPSTTAKCCTGAAPPRAETIQADCPLGRVLDIGQNADGIGPKQNCDRLFIRNFAQSSAELAIHIRVACISPLTRVIVNARLVTSPRGDVVNQEAGVFLDAVPEGGFYVRRNIRFPVLGGGPYVDLDGAEGNLTVTVSELPPSTVSVTKTLRVRLTFSAPPDLPE